MGMAGGAYDSDVQQKEFNLKQAQIINAANAAANENYLNRKRLRMNEEKNEADLELDRERLANQRQAQIDLRKQNEFDNRIKLRDADIREKRFKAEEEDRKRQQKERENERLRQQQSIFDEFRQVETNEKQMRQQKRAYGQNIMGCLMKYAMRGEPPPQSTLKWASRKMGLDGVTSGIGGAYYDKAGNFYLDIIRKGPDGRTRVGTEKLPFQGVGGMMYNNPVAFNNADRKKWRDGMRARGYSENEINTFCGVNNTEYEALDDEGKKKIQNGFLSVQSGVDYKTAFDYQDKALKLQGGKIDNENKKVILETNKAKLDALRKKSSNRSLSSKQRWVLDNIEKFQIGKDAEGKPVLRQIEDAFTAAGEFYDKHLTPAEEESKAGTEVPEEGEGGSNGEPGETEAAPEPVSEEAVVENIVKAEKPKEEVKEPEKKVEELKEEVKEPVEEAKELEKKAEKPVEEVKEPEKKAEKPKEEAKEPEQKTVEKPVEKKEKDKKEKDKADPLAKWRRK